MTKHSEASLVHVPYSFSYANTAARTGATGLLPADVGKLARQLDDNTLWMLTDDSPVTWIAIGSSGGGTLTNSNISPTTANVTAVVNYRYFANVSGLTANRNFVIPAGAVGDIIELNIKTGDDTYALIVIGDTGISINGGTAATEWSRLFITNETVQLIADTTSNWQVVEDRRLPCLGRMTKSAAQTTNTGGVATLVTFANKPVDRGELGNVSSHRFTIRRAGYYMPSASLAPNVSPGSYLVYYIYKGGTGGTLLGQGQIDATSNGIITLGTPAPVTSLIVGDYVDMYFQSGNNNVGVAVTGTFFQIEEVF